MDPVLAQQVVEYISVTQPALDKAAALRETMGGYREKIANAIDQMVDRGLVPLRVKTAMFNDLATNPEKAADLLLHLIEKSATAHSFSLGGPSDRMDESGYDPIVGFVLADRH